ncbi:MAG TPA: S9 family peptidase [Burkholderiaceae bacterium]|jgi:dipeptidyl aminopeptidase/acylaminoacyl peptidase|nr:S9 family peptidase [Burkholderiaceae bacterium]
MTDESLPPIYPLTDFFRNPERGFYRLSDDGTLLAYMEPVAFGDGPPRRNLFVQPLEGSQPVGEARCLTRETDRDIAEYYWKGSDILLYAKDFEGDENFHVVAVDVNSAAVSDLTPYPDTRAGIADELYDDPDHILIAHNHRDAQAFDVYRVNVRTGEETPVAENPGNIVAWHTDHHGRVRAATASDGLETTLLYRENESEPFRPIITTDFRTTVSPELFTFDDRKLYALSNRDRDCLALVVIDPENPDLEQLVFEVPGVDLEGVSYSRLRHVLTAALYQTDRPKYHFFDQLAAERHLRVSEALPGYEIMLQSGTRDERKFIVAAYNDRTPGSRFLYDDESGSLTKLGDINPALPESDMAEVRPIQYTSRDGLVIHGYLTLPKGRDPKGLPCVVNPHGGPWTRDGWGFNPEAQFLANRGYCVLQMNFRGSTGYGRQFWEAGFGQWGLAMQDDITDGVQWLIDQGIVDRNRIAIYGGSYGGYAVLSGITRTPDLYAAAVDFVGVSNLLTFLNTIPPYWKPMLEKMHSMVGHPERDRERLVATSPALNAEHIRTPLFIAQGARDPRVNKDESDQMVAALRARGVEVEYMVKENEGHGFHNDENKFEFYERMEAFLSQHLGGATPMPGSSPQ